VIAAELAVPVLAAMFITWFAIGIGALSGYLPQIVFILVVPTVIITIVLAAVFDILRKCHGSELLAGEVMESGAGGLILGCILAGIPLLIVYWLTYQVNSPGVSWMMAFFGSALSLGVSYLLWKLSASLYKGIK